jgi:hypothetical protein
MFLLTVHITYRVLLGVILFINFGTPIKQLLIFVILKAVILVFNLNLCKLQKMHSCWLLIINFTCLLLILLGHFHLLFRKCSVMKDNVMPLQTWTVSYLSSRMRLPEFVDIGTGRWKDCQS